MQIQARSSRRSYESGPLTKNELTDIQKVLDKTTSGPFGTSLGFQLISKNDAQNQKLKLGTYGFIQGAQYFILGSIEASQMGFIDYGYVLEDIILQLTAMDLGTCWLGGTFDRSEFSKAIKLEPGWVIPAITPVGRPTINRSLGDRLVRFGAKSKNRKNWSELFFHNYQAQALSQEQAGWAKLPLEGLRLAPSASNLQPWRVVVTENDFDFFLDRKKGYRNLFSAVDIQMIDMGIAMMHFSGLCREMDQPIEWLTKSKPNPFFNLEYIVSARI